MSVELTWLGHGSWQIKTSSHALLLDPFLNDSPTSPVKADDVEADFILVSHGHFDHVSDVQSIAGRTSATVIAMVEAAEWFKKQGVENTVGMNLNSGVEFPFGVVRMTPALHSASMPDGSYGGVPVGFVLTLEQKRIYFACDTALFSDMQLIGRLGIDLAVLPIGDFFTMGPDDALEAVRLIKPKRVAPAHYGTWPPIEQDARGWTERVSAETDAKGELLEPGGKLTL